MKDNSLENYYNPKDSQRAILKFTINTNTINTINYFPVYFNYSVNNLPNSEYYFKLDYKSNSCYLEKNYFSKNENTLILYMVTFIQLFKYNYYEINIFPTNFFSFNYSYLDDSLYLFKFVFAKNDRDSYNIIDVNCRWDYSYQKINIIFSSNFILI